MPHLVLALVGAHALEPNWSQRQRRTPDNDCYQTGKKEQHHGNQEPGPPARASSPNSSEKEGGSKDRIQLSGFRCHLLARKLSTATHWSGAGREARLLESSLASALLLRIGLPETWVEWGGVG